MNKIAKAAFRAFTWYYFRFTDRGRKLHRFEQEFKKALRAERDAKADIASSRHAIPPPPPAPTSTGDLDEDAFDFVCIDVTQNDGRVFSGVVRVVDEIGRTALVPFLYRRDAEAVSYTHSDERATQWTRKHLDTLVAETAKTQLERRRTVLAGLN